MLKHTRTATEIIVTIRSSHFAYSSSLVNLTVKKSTNFNHGMATSVQHSAPPVPRPRQCWQKDEKIPPETRLTPEKLSSNSSICIDLSEDDLYRFLVKEFWPSRSLANTSQANATPATSPFVKPTEKAPPKPPRLKNDGPPCNITNTPVTQNGSKAPMPLPRTMFLAIKTPPKLPSRPPVVFRTDK